MSRGTGWLILAATLVAFAATGARASEWVPVDPGAKELTEIDLASAEVRKDRVKLWVRRTLAKAEEDEQVHQPWTVEMVLATEDCANRTLAISDFVRRDKDGASVRSGSRSGAPSPVIPESVGEAAWRTACALAHPPKEEPYTADFEAGGWRRLGDVADHSYVEWLKTGDIVKLQSCYVVAISRSDYKAPAWRDGYAIRHIVTAQAIDCQRKQTAVMGMDYYVAPDLRVAANRVDPDDADFQTIPPRTFLGRYLADICKLARPVTDDDAADGGAGVVSGTAWGVDKGYLATAAHVIEGAKRIEVYRDADKIGEAKVVVADKANDLAILEFTKGRPATLKVLPLSSRSAALGAAVFTLGYPAPELLGQAIKMTSGQVNSTAGMEDDTRMLQISAPVQSGNSGGPVLGWDGAVVGVVDMKLDKLDDDGKERPQNVNYAIKAAYLHPLLDDLPDLGGYEPVKPGSGQEQIVAAVRQAVFMVLVTR